MIKKHFSKKLVMTAADKKAFKNAETCHICVGGDFDDSDEANEKVRDHCHFTAKFRGCKRVYRTSKSIPVVFHNLRGYDAHFIVLEMGNFKRQINIIPNNFERYMTINCGKFRFIDSFQFMASGLDRLVGNLPIESMVQTKAHFPGKNKFELVRRKGVYPYGYFDSMDKFKERTISDKIVLDSS